MMQITCRDCGADLGSSEVSAGVLVHVLGRIHDGTSQQCPSTMIRGLVEWLLANEAASLFWV